ncbi:uncharacterized protein LOC135929696 isoform X2 [Gordionus sp. m RMFG-2023]|uniref:uncharacterized protein LOC135929696 isoform X2 n=1 Tax=Gordionus sp. m RMFG-2023 TaxID=3053472 RepID=UPI0031FE1412
MTGKLISITSSWPACPRKFYSNKIRSNYNIWLVILGALVVSQYFGGAFPLMTGVLANDILIKKQEDLSSFLRNYGRMIDAMSRPRFGRSQRYDSFNPGPYSEQIANNNPKMMLLKLLNRDRNYENY